MVFIVSFSCHCKRNNLKERKIYSNSYFVKIQVVLVEEIGSEVATFVETRTWVYMCYILVDQGTETVDQSEAHLLATHFLFQSSKTIAPWGTSVQTHEPLTNSLPLNYSILLLDFIGSWLCHIEKCIQFNLRSPHSGKLLKCANVPSLFWDSRQTLIWVSL